MKGRTVILVSHHVQLCAPGAAYVVALENGRTAFSGKQGDFMGSSVMKGLVQSHTDEKEDEKDAEKDAELIADEKEKEETVAEVDGDKQVANGTPAPGDAAPKVDKKPARKLVEEEKRAVGRVGRDIWTTYLRACGGKIYWGVFGLSLLLATVIPIFENGWLRCVVSYSWPLARLLMTWLGYGRAPQ